MTPIQNVHIVGAGAMGAAYAALFTEAEGFQVAFVARGERRRRLAQNDLTVNATVLKIIRVLESRPRQPV